MDLDVMLCDHAQVADGKLFVQGGGIDRMDLPAGSAPPFIANFGVAGLIRVPWNATNAEHVMTFTFVTEDGRVPELPTGADAGPNGISGEMRFNVGRPPQLASGQEQSAPFAFNFQGLPLMAPGRYALVLSLDGTEHRRLTFTVTVAQQSVFTVPTGF